MSRILQDYCPDSQKYGQDVLPLRQSKPEIPIEELLEATKPMKPFPWDKETDTSVGGALADFLDILHEIIAFFFK